MLTTPGGCLNAQFVRCSRPDWMIMHAGNDKYATQFLSGLATVRRVGL